MHRFLRTCGVLLAASGLTMALGGSIAEANRCSSGNGESLCICLGACWADATGCGCGPPPV